MVDNEFDPNKMPIIGLFSSAPEIPAGMQSTYLSNFNDFMVMTNGNVSQAEKLAFQSTKRVWGVSEAGGKRRFMQFPPESFYHVEGFDDDWIDDQLLEDLEGMGVEDAVMGVDALTARSSKPSYPILAPNKNGVLDILEDENGQPLRFQPDFAKTTEYQDLANAPQKAVMKAEERMQRNLTEKANKIRRKVNASLWRELGVSVGEREEFIKTDEGKTAIQRPIQLRLGRGPKRICT